MRIFKKKKNKEEIVEKAKPVEKKTVKAPVEKTKTKEKVVDSNKPKVWHITKRTEDKKWQVKAEGATKATKLFHTKAEAEEYVKTLKANNEGSRIVPHKKDGKYQKK